MDNVTCVMKKAKRGKYDEVRRCMVPLRDMVELGI